MNENKITTEKMYEITNEIRMNTNEYERIQMHVNKITNKKMYEITNEIRMYTIFHCCTTNEI